LEWWSARNRCVLGKNHASQSRREMLLFGANLMLFLSLLFACCARVCTPASVRQLKLAISQLCSTSRFRRADPIPRSLLAALVAGEDHRFYKHRGFDPIAMAGAFYRFVAYGRLGGASTLEQQFVRILTGRAERSLRRKLREIALACYVSRKYRKSEIAEMYLTVAYFGWRMKGFEEACNTLSIAAPRMTVREAASLIARLKYPQPSELTKERQALIARRTDHIYKLMYRSNSISSEVMSNATILGLRKM
jgi:membrane peptidoglycan carboxypeptidase